MQSINAGDRRIGKQWIYQNRITGDYVAVDEFNRDIMSLFRDRNQTLEIAPDDLFIEGYLAIKNQSTGMIDIDTTQILKIKVKSLKNTCISIGD